MPPVMLALQYGITFLLVKQLGASQVHTSPVTSPFVGFASGSEFALIGLGLTVLGLAIVYNGTQDIGLTFGYFVVKWVEGYLLGFVLTAGVFVNALGLHATRNPTITRPPGTAGAVVIPPAAGGPGAAPGSVSPEAVRVLNAQGVVLAMTGGMIGVALPSQFRIDGQLIDTRDSKVRLYCISANGMHFSLAPRTLRPGGHPVLWRLPTDQRAITTCDGAVALAHGGIRRLNQPTTMHTFNLRPWTLAHH